MQSEQRRKRKRFLKPLFSSSSIYYSIRCCALFLFVAFFVFFNGFSFRSGLLVKSTLTVFGSTHSFPPLKVEGCVLFPDHVLLLVSKSNLHKGLDCIYSEKLYNSSSRINTSRIVLPVISVDEYSELQSIARCPLPPSNYSALVHLRTHKGLVMVDQRFHSWETLVYAVVLDGDTAVVFVKGLNLRPGRVSDPGQFRCHFNRGDDRYDVTTNAVTAAQEIIRCSLPFPLPNRGVQVSVAIGGRRRSRSAKLDSVAKMNPTNLEEEGEKQQYELCVCTMLWNQASSLREWIVYHAWLGVERWFIYDNNSDDEIEKVIEELERENYNVTRHVWPWIKSQEAGFSHCILKARNECKWVAFMDVDEFFYFPFPTAHHGNPSESVRRHSLKSLVRNISSSKTIGEIRTVCHSFGPSGLISPPSLGVTVGYTCRLQSPERHKSIVRPDALDESLLNVVHHFRLRRGYKYMNLPQYVAVINHYKYQVWQVFRSKFFRRVATYVTDWQENQNEGSKDRAPGLGTEAIEPPNWRLQFCEIWDTGLRDFVVANLADSISGSLPWEKPHI